MGAPTLRQLSMDACISNVRRIDDVGNAPYKMVRAILHRIENPKQLRQIEENCPQLCGEDAEIWRMFIKRDIPNSSAKNYEPKDPKNWWQVYQKLRKEADREEAEQGAALKAALNKRAAEKSSNRIEFTDTDAVQQAKRSQRNSRMGMGRGRHGFSGSRPTKPGSLQSAVFGKRRTVNHSRMATPTHLLNNRTGLKDNAITKSTKSMSTAQGYNARSPNALRSAQNAMPQSYKSTHTGTTLFSEQSASTSIQQHTRNMSPNSSTAIIVEDNAVPSPPRKATVPKIPVQINNGAVTKPKRREPPSIFMNAKKKLKRDINNR